MSIQTRDCTSLAKDLRTDFGDRHIDNVVYQYMDNDIRKVAVCKSIVVKHKKSQEQLAIQIMTKVLNNLKIFGDDDGEGAIVGFLGSKIIQMDIGNSNSGALEQVIISYPALTEYAEAIFEDCFEFLHQQQGLYTLEEIYDLLKD